MWWRVLLAFALPSLIVSGGVAARYSFNWHSEVIDPAALLFGVAVGALLFVPQLRGTATRVWAFVGYVFGASVLSFVAGLTIACKFGDCL